MTTEKTMNPDLERFMHSWGSVRAIVEKDFITYKVTPHYGKKAVIAANAVISDLGLSERLVAVGSGLHSDDSFSVQIKKK